MAEYGTGENSRLYLSELKECGQPCFGRLKDAENITFNQKVSDDENKMLVNRADKRNLTEFFNACLDQLIGSTHVKISDKDAYNCTSKVFTNIENISNEKLVNFYFEKFDKGENMDNIKKSKEDQSGKLDSAEKIVENALDNNKQVIFTGAPGTGKTYGVKKYVEKKCNNQDFYKFVQFHSSYDYSDFIEGLRPAPDENGGNIFVRMDGVFKAFCRKIVEANSGLNEYYFIIDEINRADLSKVFGELMFCLDENYRGIENRVDTQYKNLDTYEMTEIEKDGVTRRCAVPMDFDCFRDGFFMPENIHIIGTMNDIDRSVESFDFALRRRFEWIPIRANDVMKATIRNMLNPNDEELEKLGVIVGRIQEMNRCLSNGKFGLTEDYHIGPAYFKGLNKDDIEGSLETIFSHKIEPIIREYTRGRNGVDGFVEECRKSLLKDK